MLHENKAVVQGTTQVQLAALHGWVGLRVINAREKLPERAKYTQGTRTAAISLSPTEWLH